MSSDELKVTLRDGTPCVLRLCRVEAGPCDKECIKRDIDAGMHQLSDRSRRLRFAGGVSRLTEGQLNYLANLDNTDRLAWCAFNITDSQHRGIGLARYMRLPEEPEVAEFAITIIDQYQGRGLGSILLDRLMESAKDNGIRTLRGYVLQENDAMLRLARRAGARKVVEDHLLKVELSL